MSNKRQAPTELNHENWDQEDSEEREEMGTFKTAPKEVLEKRVIRTAKRRSQVSSDEPKKSVFSGFGGFNKAQQTSFDFLANLTNGAKQNAPPTTKTDTAVSSSIFSNTSPSSTSSSGIFSVSGSSGFATKPSLGNQSEGSIFGSSAANNSSPVQSIFTATKADSTVHDSPFKIQPTPATNTATKPNINADAATSQVSSTIFGAPSNSGPNKSLFSSTASNSTLFSTQAVSSTSTSSVNSAITTKAESSIAQAYRKNKEKEARKLTYFAKIKGLNESVSDWIKKHVEEDPLCILSPIFKDYDNYLKEIEEEYKGGEKNVTSDDKEKNVTSDDKKAEPKPVTETNNTPASNNVNSSTIFGNSISSNVGKSENNKSEDSTKSTPFSFGINPSTTTTPNTGFSFGINTPTHSTASSLFSVNTSTTVNATVSSPFSFGINKSGFGFNAPPPKTETSEAANEEDDEPPKVEFTPVVEENSVFDRKCKIFIKKDGNFVDKGVGTLYIKKIEESGKHQLLVRANTNLGTILLNLILSSSIPTQRMGKNNVMLVCIPTPDAKPPPTPIVIRVKTTEEADDLLSTLDKYKA